MPRLFSGISLPEEIKDQILDLNQPLPGARWIDADDLHLTLKFVGDLDNHTADEFAYFVSEISHINVFKLRLCGVSTFGNRCPHTIWAGVEGGPELERLARAHETAGRAAGVPKKRRQFHPHVTIARLRHPWPDELAKFLSFNANFRSQTFTVTHTTLFAAKPMTGGGPYLVEQRFPLAGAFAINNDELIADT